MPFQASRYARPEGDLPWDLPSFEDTGAITRYHGYLEPSTRPFLSILAGRLGASIGTAEHTDSERHVSFEGRISWAALVEGGRTGQSVRSGAGLYRNRRRRRLRGLWLSHRFHVRTEVRRYLIATGV